MKEGRIYDNTEYNSIERSFTRIEADGTLSNLAYVGQSIICIDGYLKIWDKEPIG